MVQSEHKPPKQPPHKDLSYKEGDSLYTGKKVTGIKDEIVRLVKSLNDEHGIMVDTVKCDWERHRATDGRRLAMLADVKFTVELV
jgi:hypothetical protein